MAPSLRLLHDAHYVSVDLDVGCVCNVSVFGPLARGHANVRLELVRVVLARAFHDLGIEESSC